MIRQAGNTSQADEGPRLSPEAAFVVQIGSEASIEDGRVSGRVEHVATGTSEPFATLDELLRFMTRLRGIRPGTASAL